MKTENNLKAKASRLHDILGEMGYPLSLSQCIDVMRDLKKQLNNKNDVSVSDESRSTAERYMNDMVDAFMTQNYKKATQYTEKKFRVHFNERGFNRDVQNSREDLGTYVGREFLGSLEAESHPEDENIYPEHMRYVWRGIFEKNEALMIMNLYKKEGNYYVSDTSCR